MHLRTSQLYYVLVDCNNFFASCETLFNPKLLGKPLVVLSNNDGCVIARSAEAKQLGIPMGVPYFKISDFCRRNRVAVVSSNFSLYGNLSGRVMSILGDFCPDMEIYSIDEAFLTFPISLTLDKMQDLCSQMRQRIKQWLGIPVSFGIAPTKMLAKLANSKAKCSSEGIFELYQTDVRERVLKETSIDDLWGIGHKLSKRLWREGIETSWDLHEAKPESVRKKFGVVGERWVHELRGISCLALDDSHAKKSITCSRSFGHPLTDFFSLMEGMAHFTSRACEKLRAQEGVARTVSIFLAQSDKKAEGYPFLYTSQLLQLPYPTADTTEVLKAVREGLENLFRANTPYKKGGVILTGLSPQGVQHSLFQLEDSPKRALLLKTVDELNRKHSNKLSFGTAVGKERWRGKSNWRSQSVLTSWHALPIVKA